MSVLAGDYDSREWLVDGRNLMDDFDQAGS